MTVFVDFFFPFTGTFQNGIFILGFSPISDNSVFKGPKMRTNRLDIFELVHSLTFCEDASLYWEKFETNSGYLRSE